MFFSYKKKSINLILALQHEANEYSINLFLRPPLNTQPLKLLKMKVSLQEGCPCHSLLLPTLGVP